MKLSVFWKITLFSLGKVNQGFGGLYRLHFQDLRVSQARIQHETSSKFRNPRVCKFPPSLRIPAFFCARPALLAICFRAVSCVAYISILKIQAVYSPKHRLTITVLHGVISYTTRLFITVLTRARDCTLFWPNLIPVHTSHLIVLRSISITSSYLCLRLPVGFSYKVFWPKFCFHFLFPLCMLQPRPVSFFLS
jgi:hypothetical protein